MIPKIKAAVVGCGVISDIYIKNLQERFSVVDVVVCCDLSEERMHACAEKYGLRAMTIDEICADGEIAMVLNLTTPAAHYSIGKRCMEAGKHVFSEKMIAVTPEEGKELVEIAHKNNVRLGVAPDTFLGASVQTAKYIVDHGLIGKPLSFRAHISRNYAAFGEILPHLYKKGAGIAFDMGGYYLTALAAILGPCREVSAFTRIENAERTNTRVGSNGFGEGFTIEEPNVIAAALSYDNGVLGTVHMNSDTLVKETSALEIYGTDGILYMGNPNTFGAPVYLKKAAAERVEFPMTHGFAELSRGVGAAEMAWSILANRPHRASSDMAYHVFEIVHGMMQSAASGGRIRLQSGFAVPAALPEGFIGSGNWTRKEESALI